MYLIVAVLRIGVAAVLFNRNGVLKKLCKQSSEIIDSQFYLIYTDKDITLKRKSLVPIQGSR